jgi:hypothetical protein
MASAELKVPATRDWVLANPWFWMALGLAQCGSAWARVFFLNALSLEDAWPAQLLLITLGLLAVGAALRIRLGSPRPAFLETASRSLRDFVLLGLMLVFGLMAITVSVLLILRIAGIDPFSIRPNKLVILWFIVTPMSVVALQFMYRKRDPSWQLSWGEESSALLALAALACFFSCRALYWGQGRAEEWDSIRLLLAVMALVAIVAAPLMVVPVNIRRGVISLLILLHFGGICTAVLAAPPAPWVIQQIWTRIYRPYLEFMYLNNAYHFYAPDPGPARYLWFRLIYDDGKGNGKDSEVGHWVKIPDFDKYGRHKYTLALQYSRYMALTENTVATSPAPPFFEMAEEKVFEKLGGQLMEKSIRKVVHAKFFELRLKHAPDWQPKLGEPGLPKGSLIIPFHPMFSPEQQYVVPSREVKQLLESFAHYVTRIPYPEHPEYKILGVRIYSLIHMIPPEGAYLLNKMHPADPEFYRPYFLGEFRFLPKKQPSLEGAVGFVAAFTGEALYTAEGELALVSDPFLYWLLPIGREFLPPIREGDPGSVLIRDYCRKHAGDPYWVQHLQVGEAWTGSTEWIKWNDGR